jgi:hypothetical protein
MNKIIPIFSLCLFFLLQSAFLILQNQKTFPALTGETLEDKKITLPADVKGKFTLIGIAYSQKSQEDLQTWLQPVYTNFIEKPSGNVLFDDSYDINVYFIPMFTGSNEAATGQAKKRLKEGLDKELQPHVLIYKGDISTYKEQLSLNDKDKPYFFLLDEEGKIVYTTSGVYSESKMKKIEELLDE